MIEPIDLGERNQCLKKTSFSVTALVCDMGFSSSRRCGLMAAIGGGGV
jgi:hypothetical protein